MAQTQTIGSHKTNIYTEADMIHIRYHDTVVVQFNMNHIFLDSGGWKTTTTKTRMNQTSNQYNLGFTVFQKDFSWYVSFNGKTLDYQDNMMLTRK